MIDSLLLYIPYGRLLCFRFTCSIQQSLGQISKTRRFSLGFFYQSPSHINWTLKHFLSDEGMLRRIYIRIYSYPWIYPQINAIMQCKLSNPLADTTELMPVSSLLVKETSMNVMLLEMRSSLVGSRSGADLSQNMGVWFSRIKPSNCFRRLEKLVLPSIFNKSLSSLMMWNLQSYPTTVLNERMWHL